MNFVFEEQSWRIKCAISLRIIAFCEPGGVSIFKRTHWSCPLDLPFMFFHLQGSRWGDLTTSSRWCAWVRIPAFQRRSCVGVTVRWSRPGILAAARSNLSNSLGFIDTPSPNLAFPKSKAAKLWAHAGRHHAARYLGKKTADSHLTLKQNKFSIHDSFPWSCSLILLLRLMDSFMW